MNPNSVDPDRLTTQDVLERFGRAFADHDPTLLDGLIADDCVLENTGPAPDGARFVGGEACQAFWTSIAANRELTFEVEETWEAGERGVRRWLLRWGAGADDCVRGVNLMRVRDGRIVEALGYVKG